MLENILADDLEFVLDQTRELWDELRGERIFITGGTGFFGCWLLESFAWVNRRLGLNSSAVVLTRNHFAFKKKAPHLTVDPAIQFCHGNILDCKFPSGSFSHIIHGAIDASAKLADENPQLMYDTIVKGTERTLTFAQHCCVKKLLFISSGAVYGKQPHEISHIAEKHTVQRMQETGKGYHGLGKITAEKMCLDWAKDSGLEVKIARCFSFVGPYLPLDIHFAIGNFILAGLTSQPIIINGDGTPYRSYLYAAELVIWLWYVLLRGRNCSFYNVGSEEEINIANLADVVAQHFEPKPSVHIKQKKNATKIVDRYIPSTQKIRDEFGLKQFINLDESIEKTKLWHLGRLRT